MHPVLFRLGSFELDSYSVIWFIALSLAITQSIRRFPPYGIDDDEGRRIIGWSFIAMLISARAFEYIWNISAYIENPSRFLDFNSGGLSEVGAFCGAFISSLLLCRRSSVSFQSLCGAAALPAMMTIAIGRWGCFLNGCCLGITTDLPTGVHFLRDADGVMRHPVQLYYSAAAAVIWAVLSAFERRLSSRYAGKDTAPARGAAITAAGLMMYAAMRLSLDVLRLPGDRALGGMSLSHMILWASLLPEAVWLAVSLRRLKAADCA